MRYRLTAVLRRNDAASAPAIAFVKAQAWVLIYIRMTIFRMIVEGYFSRLPCHNPILPVCPSTKASDAGWSASPSSVTLEEPGLRRDDVLPRMPLNLGHKIFESVQKFFKVSPLAIVL